MSEQDNIPFENLLHILRQFRTAIVVTRRNDKTLAGRPMVIADCTSAGHLWFITRVESSTIRDITENPEVAACLQADECYLSISGLARTTRDNSRIDELWDERHAVWYELGRDDPSLILLEIVPTYGEYWDRSGMSAIRFKMQELRARLTGESLDTTAGNHGDVDFSDRPG